MLPCFEHNHFNCVLLRSYRTNQNQLVGESKENNTRDIVIYSVLIGSMFVSTIVRSITFFVICTRASVRLHNKIFNRLLRVPLAFFDSNPAGRILNRFSRDLGSIDETIPYIAYDFSLVSICALCFANHFQN